MMLADMQKIVKYLNNEKKQPKIFLEAKKSPKLVS